MKKHLLILAVALLAVSIALPAFADVEFKYGGQFRARIWGEDNVRDGTNAKGFYGDWENGAYNSDDNRRLIDQRLRLYFSFIASKNLKLVWKIEMGDAVWGDPNQTLGSRVGQNSGGGVGADFVGIEVKNAYIEFNIPNTPSTALVGIQTLTLLDSWIVDDDFPAAVLVTKLDPFRVTVGYVAGQYGWEDRLDKTPAGNAVTPGLMPYTAQDGNVDDVFLAVDYKDGPFKASVVGFYQNGHRSVVSVDPTTLATPVTNWTGFGSTFLNQAAVDSNNLFDIGFNLTYKVDWLLAYVNFVQNLGSIDAKDGMVLGNTPKLVGFPDRRTDSANYQGFMVDAGVTYFCGPWTANIGGFYTSGPDISSDPTENWNGNFNGLKSGNVNWFVYPLATSKYSSEIIGGGILGDDIYAYRGYPLGVNRNIGNASAMSSVYWRGYGFPTNLWTVTAGGSYQILPTTKLSASYWYWGTSESVPVAYNINSGRFDMSSNIGHELDFYVDQGIVDGLTLTLVGAYLIADDAFCPLPVFQPTDNLSTLHLTPQADNAWKLGARLQWNF